MGQPQVMILLSLSPAVYGRDTYQNPRLRSLRARSKNRIPSGYTGDTQSLAMTPSTVEGGKEMH